MLDTIYKETRAKMEHSIKSFKNQLMKVRTGLANISLLEDIRVDYYGQPTPVNQVGTISIPEARLIVIRPWEKKMLEKIEKAILSSDIGITPNNDGNVIRLPFPSLTEERRKELVKNVKKMGEERKIAIRNIRRESNAQIKQLQKDSDITEDDEEKGLKKIQEITDEFTKEIDTAVEKKNKEIMEI
ncbi:MAG: ribosome recycling factor [Candidatus Cloacimonadota bacterium]|nr:MAG: ribosome recycling factor [Candidatus Cloacimonadota bacterium]